MPHDDRAYDRARDAFGDLKPEQQARFLFETTLSAVSHGAASVSRALADELEHLFRDAPGGSGRPTPGETDASSNRPGPAEPPTDAQRAPGEGPVGEE